MSAPHRTGMVWVVWGLVAALAVLHQDLWYWADTTLILGCLPAGLFYHAAFSLACGIVWALAVRFAWPTHIEEWADEFEPPSKGGSGS